MDLQIIQDKIYEIRGQRIMLDFDLAELYGTETKYLKRSVKQDEDNILNIYRPKRYKRGYPNATRTNQSNTSRITSKKSRDR